MKLEQLLNEAIRTNEVILSKYAKNTPEIRSEVIRQVRDILANSTNKDLQTIARDHLDAEVEARIEAQVIDALRQAVKKAMLTAVHGEDRANAILEEEMRLPAKLAETDKQFRQESKAAQEAAVRRNIQND